MGNQFLEVNLDTMSCVICFPEMKTLLREESDEVDDLKPSVFVICM